VTDSIQKKIGIYIYIYIYIYRFFFNLHVRRRNIRRKNIRKRNVGEEMAREKLNRNQEIGHFKSHKKGGVKIPKTEYAVVFVQYQVKQTY
jgi:hypothetical protein